MVCSIRLQYNPDTVNMPHVAFLPLDIIHYIATTQGLCDRDARALLSASKDWLDLRWQIPTVLNAQIIEDTATSRMLLYVPRYFKNITGLYHLDTKCWLFHQMCRDPELTNAILKQITQLHCEIDAWSHPIIQQYMKNAPVKELTIIVSADAHPNTEIDITILSPHTTSLKVVSYIPKIVFYPDAQDPSSLDYLEETIHAHHSIIFPEARPFQKPLSVYIEGHLLIRIPSLFAEAIEHFTLVDAVLETPLPPLARKVHLENCDIVNQDITNAFAACTQQLEHLHLENMFSTSRYISEDTWIAWADTLRYFADLSSVSYSIPHTSHLRNLETFYITPGNYDYGRQYHNYGMPQNIKECKDVYLERVIIPTSDLSEELQKDTYGKKRIHIECCWDSAANTTIDTTSYRNGYM